MCQYTLAGVHVSTVKRCWLARLPYARGGAAMASKSTSEAAQPESIISEIHHLDKVHDSLPQSDKVGRQVQWRKFDAARDEGYRLFGQINGWRVAARGFAIDTLGKPHGGNEHDWNRLNGERWIDHIKCYREPERPYRAVAYISQPYKHVKREPLREMLEREGFALHIPPFPLASIYYPGSTFFLVVTRPGVSVKWLPEQVRGYEGAAS
jgi:hypothetical protein